MKVDVVLLCIMLVAGLILGFLVESYLGASERDVLRERVEWQADSLRVYERQWAECQEWKGHIRIIQYERPDSEATYTDWDDVVFSVTGRNKLSIEMASDTITMIRFKDVGMIHAEPLDSAALDSLYYEIIEKPLKKWINDGRLYKVKIIVEDK